MVSLHFVAGGDVGPGARTAAEGPRSQVPAWVSSVTTARWERHCACLCGSCGLSSAVIPSCPDFASPSPASSRCIPFGAGDGSAATRRGPRAARPWQGLSGSWRTSSPEHPVSCPDQAASPAQEPGCDPSSRPLLTVYTGLKLFS